MDHLWSAGVANSLVVGPFHWPEDCEGSDRSVIRVSLGAHSTGLRTVRSSQYSILHSITVHTVWWHEAFLYCESLGTVRGPTEV